MTSLRINGIANLESTSTLNTCQGCSKSIYDQYLLKIGGHDWHEECVKCESCGMQLYDKCFERDLKLYCKTHYYRLHSPYKCSGCHQGVSPSDMVYKFRNGLLYHTTCHRCTQCGRALQQGEEICVDESTNSVACMCHFKHLVRSSDNGHPPQDPINEVQATPVPPTFPMTDLGHNNLMDEQNIPLNAMDANCGMNDHMDMYSLYSMGEDGLHGLSAKNYLKRRGPRTTIKHYQLDVLNRTFNATPKPSKHARAKLALETGLSMRVIQVWFQNRRSKERRLKHLCNWIRENESRGLIPPISPSDQPTTSQHIQNSLSPSDLNYSDAMLSLAQQELGDHLNDGCSVPSGSVGMESDEYDIDDEEEFDEEDSMFIGAMESLNHSQL